MFSAPIYGCDVAEPLSDPDLNVWNISKLGCILDMIKEDKNTSIQVGIVFSRILIILYSHVRKTGRILKENLKQTYASVNQNAHISGGAFAISLLWYVEGNLQLAY